VSIGNRSWRERVVGEAVELKRGVKPFLEKNWVSVHSAGDFLLGFNLAGSSKVREKLSDCEPTENRNGWLPLTGEITASSDDRIIKAIRRQRPEGLLLDSVGGLTEEAQRIGYAVHEAGMATKARSDRQCLSECTFILATGRPRTVDVGGRVGISNAIAPSGPVSAHAGDAGSATSASPMPTTGPTRRRRSSAGANAIRITGAATARAIPSTPRVTAHDNA
jgi:hypothetical protein